METSDVLAVARRSPVVALVSKYSNVTRRDLTSVSDVLMRIHKGLKQAFDPMSVFNPGRLYAEL